MTAALLPLDDIDKRLLALLQADAGLTNQALAAQAHISAPTCLRRVRRLRQAGVIERITAVVSPAAVDGLMTAIVEVTLDRQDATAQEQFEATMAAEAAVQQCYRVASGPDFVLIVVVADMANYYAFVQRSLTAQHNVRNVRAFFAVRRSKFAPAVPV